MTPPNAPLPLPANRWARYVDRDLVIALLALIGIGVVMLASASLWVAEKQYQDAYFYVDRQLTFLGIGLCLGLIMYQIRLAFGNNSCASAAFCDALADSGVNSVWVEKSMAVGVG